jgi:hypothetical protein
MTKRQKDKLIKKLRYYKRVLKYWCFGFYTVKDGFYYIKCPPYPVNCLKFHHKVVLIDHVLCKPANPLEIDLYP